MRPLYRVSEAIGSRSGSRNATLYACTRVRIADQVMTSLIALKAMTSETDAKAVDS